jgi:hypothetical protein
MRYNAQFVLFDQSVNQSLFFLLNFLTPRFEPVKAFDNESTLSRFFGTEESENARKNLKSTNDCCCNIRNFHIYLL